MKRFDTESVRERLIERLRYSKYWSSIPKEGPVYEAFTGVSEVFNESSRYLEFLYREKKWDDIKTFEALKDQAKLIGYKLRRKSSAFGTVIVSHPDPLGNHRLPNLGTYFLNLDTSSEYDDSEEGATSYTAIQAKALTPNYEAPYTIPVGMEFKGNNGKTYTVVKDAIVGQKTSSTITDVNTKYAVVEVVEGKFKSLELGVSNGSKDQVYTVLTDKIEAARTKFTKELLYAVMIVDGQASEEKWTEVNFIEDAFPEDKVFQIDTNEDGSSLIIFGNGLNGAIPPNKATIELHYLETSGEEGNLTEKYAMNLSYYEAPANSEFSKDINVQNTSYILGGKNYETLEEAKRNAENYARSVDLTNLNIKSISNYLLENISIPMATLNASRKDLNFYQNTTNALNMLSITAIGVDGKDLSAQNQKSLVTQANFLGATKVISAPYFAYEKPRIAPLGFAALIKEASKRHEKTRQDIKDIVSSYWQKNLSYLARDFNSSISISSLQQTLLRQLTNSDVADTSFYLAVQPSEAELEDFEGLTELQYVILKFDLTPYLEMSGYSLSNLMDIDFSRSYCAGLTVKNSYVGEKTYFFYSNTSSLNIGSTTANVRNSLTKTKKVYFQENAPLIYKENLDLSNLIYNVPQKTYNYSAIPYYLSQNAFYVGMPLSDFNRTYVVASHSTLNAEEVINDILASNITFKMKILASSLNKSGWNYFSFIKEQDILFE